MMSDKKIISSKKIDSFPERSIVLLAVLVNMIISLKMVFTPNLKESTTSPTNNPSPNIVQDSNLDSLQSRKVIAWFCAGVFGYGAIYAVGKNISDRK